MTTTRCPCPASLRAPAITSLPALAGSCACEPRCPGAGWAGHGPAAPRGRADVPGPRAGVARLVLAVLRELGHELGLLVRAVDVQRRPPLDGPVPLRVQPAVRLVEGRHPPREPLPL